MPIRLTPRQTLDALIDLFAPEIRSAFLAAIQDIVDTTLIIELIRTIELGDIEAAFRTLGFSPAAMRPLTAAIESAFERGGVMTGSTFPKYLNMASGRGVFRFDVRNSRAESWLRDHSSELVTRLSEDARVNVRNTLERGMQDGRNPRNVALDIVGRIEQATGHRSGGIVGLTQQQEYWVASARRRLLSADAGEREKYFGMELRDKRFDRTVASAIADNKPLPVETVDRLISRYKDNALKLRGETIGRTEAMQSLNRSEYEAVLQAVELGAARAEAVQRIWDNAGDTRVRFSHVEMEGQSVGLNEPFKAPSGALMLFPGDTSLGAGGEEVINCRCRARTRIDWLAGLT